MAYFLDVAILIGDAELAKCLAQHCASFPRSRWRYQEFVKISQHDGTVSAMDIQEQDVLMAALAASVALETLQADDLSVVEAVVLLGDEVSSAFMLFCLGWLWTSTGQDAHFELGSDAMAVTAQLLDLEDFRLFLDQSHRISLGAQGCGVLRIGNQFEGPQVVQASRSFRVCLAWVQSLPAAVVNLVLDGRHWPRFWRDERRSFHSWATGWRSQGTEGTRMLRELANLSQDGPAEYTVAQGVCFIKPSEDPQSGKILKAKRPVGSKIYTTGTTWKGPQGGLWAEVDVARSPGEMGWVLVSGPGFGLRGPCLIDPEANDGASQMIHIRWLKDPPIFNCMMPKAATVGDLVDTFCSRTGLNRKETILTKGLPRKAPNGTGALLPVDYTDPKDVLFREMTIEEAQIRDTLNLVYVGHFDEDYNPS
eukprot:s87_g28.t1